MIRISEIIQDRINSSSLNGNYFKVSELEKDRNEIAINSYMPAVIQLLENPGCITKIPGYCELVKVLNRIEIDGFVFKYSSTTKQNKQITIYFRVQEGRIDEEVHAVLVPEQETEAVREEIIPAIFKEKKKKKKAAPVVADAVTAAEQVDFMEVENGDSAGNSGEAGVSNTD